MTGILPDVVVVGSGAIGASCARALAIAGARVTIVQGPDLPGDAWRASAGMIAAQIETGPDDPLVNLALAGRTFLKRNIPALQQSTGINVGLVETGILEVVRAESDVEPMMERVAWQRQQAQRADWLTAAEVAEGWPWLGPCAGGFWSPEDGALDPLQLVAAFLADATQHGARIVRDTVTGLDRHGDRLLGVMGRSDRYSAGAVVIAAGAWSGQLAGLPRPLSVEPVRGQMLAYPWPMGRATAIVYGEGCYLLRRGNELMVGASVEHAGFDAATTAAAGDDLQRRAALVCPSLAGVPVTRSWAGLRPWTPDGLPIIGPEPRLPGLWYATGHGRNGILLAGITGDLIARGIAGEVLAEQLHACRPERFWEW